MSYRINVAVVGTFRSRDEAELAKSVLDAIGVESLIRSDNVGGMYPALIAVELLVRAEDAARAKEVLRRSALSAE